MSDWVKKLYWLEWAFALTAHGAVLSLPPRPGSIAESLRIAQAQQH